MNQELHKRLAALETRRREATSGHVFFGFNVGDDGEIESYTLPHHSRPLTPDEFWAIVEEWSDVVFTPGRPIPDKRIEAYYELEDAALTSISWEDFQRENEAVANGEFEGPGVIEAAFEAARAANPERARLADEHEEEWDWAERFYWGPMRERADRLRERAGTLPA